MLRHHLTESIDFDVKCSDEANFAGSDDRERLLHWGRLTQRGGAQHRLDLGCASVDVAAVGAFQRGRDPRFGQARGKVRVRCRGEQCERVRLVEITEGGERCGEVFP